MRVKTKVSSPCKPCRAGTQEIFSTRFERSMMVFRFFFVRAVLLVLLSERGITKGGLPTEDMPRKRLTVTRSMATALAAEEGFRPPPEPRGGERGGGGRGQSLRPTVPGQTKSHRNQVLFSLAQHSQAPGSVGFGEHRTRELRQSGSLRTRLSGTWTASSTRFGTV